MPCCAQPTNTLKGLGAAAVGVKEAKAKAQVATNKPIARRDVLNIANPSKI